MYNRYIGNTGRVERVEDRPPPPPDPGPAAPPPPPPPRQPEHRPPEAFPGGLGRLLRRLSPGRLETEDLLLISVLYLLYRESGDVDFLVMIGGLLLL